MVSNLNMLLVLLVLAADLLISLSFPSVKLWWLAVFTASVVLFFRPALKGGVSEPARLFLMLLFVVFARLLFYDYGFEVLGETGAAYIDLINSGHFPGRIIAYYNSTASSTVRSTVFFTYTPGVHFLFYFISNELGLEPLIAVKAVRIALAFLNTLLVYFIADSAADNKRIALAASLIYAFNYNQTVFIPDQFRNFLGETFSLGCLYVIMKLPELNRLRRVGRPLFGLLFLAMIASHRLYSFLFPLLFFQYHISKRIVNALVPVIREKGWRLAVTPLVVAISTLLFLRGVLLFLPGRFPLSNHFFDYVNSTRALYTSMGYSYEVTSPGVFLYNLWAGSLILGAFIYRNSLLKKDKVYLLYCIFIFLFALSKGYIVGFYLLPDRFQLLIPPLLGFFTASILYSLFISRVPFGKPVSRLIFSSIIGLIVLESLLVAEIGGEKQHLVTKAMSVDVTNLATYLLGDSHPHFSFSFLIILTIFLFISPLILSSKFFSGLQERLFPPRANSSNMFAALGVISFISVTISILFALEYQKNLIVLAVTALYPFFLMGYPLTAAIKPIGHGQLAMLEICVFTSVVSLGCFVLVWLAFMLPYSAAFISWPAVSLAVFVSTLSFPVLFQAGMVLKDFRKESKTKSLKRF